jgi:hypothetical protein
MAHGDTGALLSREAGPETVGCMAVPETSQTGRQGPIPLDTWQRVVTRLLLALAWSLHAGVLGL